jgi:hypothetical protein
MAGRPLKNPNDMKLFRDQYLATLKLQSDINDANLHANQMYVKTGMTPNAPLDTRTTTEMVSDIVRLRTEVMKGLREIADGQNSQAIVSGLNGPQLEFVAQHMPEIIAILKPKYKYGIPSEAFLQSFLIPYMNSQFRQNMVQVGLPQNMADAEGPMPQAIEIPHAQAVSLYKRIQKADEEGDDETVTRLGNEFYNLYPTDELLDRVLELMRTKRDGEPSPPPPPVDEEEDESIEPKSKPESSAKEAESYYEEVSSRFPLTKREELYREGDNGDKLFQFGNMIQSSTALSRMNKTQMEAYLSDVRKLVVPPFTRELEKGSPTKTKVNPNKLYYSEFGPTDKSKASIAIQIRNVNKYLGEVYERLMGTDIIPVQGYGLSKHKKMVGKGISPSMKWTTFGKNKIDTHKLDNNILAMRTSTGNAVAKYPTQSISKHVSSVIQSMLQNQTPSFEMLSNLSPDDKSFVKKLTKHSGVFGTVGSGLPNNPRDDEDVTEFNIMRGEILSGNDSEILIKNFKKKILQLMSRDLLPKSQGKELLIELATLD